MRLLGFLVAITLSSGLLVAQQRPEGGVTAPKKGDIVTIRGCLAWPMLIKEGMAKPEITSTGVTAYKYRLSGDKNLVKPLQKDHEHTIVEVTGVLRTTDTSPNKIPPPATRSKEMGKTKVYVGGSDSVPRPPEEADMPPLLRVTAFLPTHARCTHAP